MILVDILCVYSLLNIVLLYRKYKKVYYILKSDGWLDRLAIGLLKYFGWDFVLLEYELKPADSRSPFLDVHKDLMAMVEKYINPAIEKKIKAYNFFSGYEKKRISTYIAWPERSNLYRSIEILHILELLKDQIDKPKAVLLHWSRWKDEISAKYSQMGLNVHFYRIYSTLKLQLRSNYFRDKLVREAIKPDTFFGLCSVFYKVMLDIFYSAYFGILRKMSSDIPQKLGKFNICAIVPGYSRTKWVSDLHWKKINSENNYRTLAIVYGELDDYSYSNFGDLAERWVRLDRVSSPNIYSVYYWLWPHYPRLLVYNLAKLLSSMLFSDMARGYKRAIFSLFMEVSKMQALFRATGAKVFWSSIEGNHFESIAGTLAINREGGVSLGATWSAWTYLATPTLRNTNDILFVWGTRHAKIFSQGGSIFKSMIIAGYPGDHYLSDYLSKAQILRAEWKKEYGNKKIICCYDNLFKKDDSNNFSDTIEFMSNLFSWVLKEPETLLVIKSKRKQIFDVYPDSIRDFLKRLEEQKRLIYEFELGDLSPGIASDIIIGFNMSTLPCLLGTYGREVILFDPNKFNERRPIGADNIKFIGKSEDIIASLDNWLREAYTNNIKEEGIKLNPNPNQMDSFADGKSIERITEYISILLAELGKGLNSDKAIYDTNTLYQKRWDPQNVIISNELQL